jgi:hypothetical protein
MDLFDGEFPRIGGQPAPAHKTKAGSVMTGILQRRGPGRDRILKLNDAARAGVVKGSLRQGQHLGGRAAKSTAKPNKK